MVAFMRRPNWPFLRHRLVGLSMLIAALNVPVTVEAHSSSSTENEALLIAMALAVVGLTVIIAVAIGLERRRAQRSDVETMALLGPGADRARSRTVSSESVDLLLGERGSGVGDMIPAMSHAPFRAQLRFRRVSFGRLACLWLVLVLVLLAFETGHHSVHHLSDDATAACVMASAVGHAPAVEAPPVAIVPVAQAVGSVAADAPLLGPSTRPVGVHQGRAPPPSLSA
jgi:hypothetical protein